jgi:hypothetical protein
MQSSNTDILCVNTQSQLGQDSKRLVRLARQGDVGTLHFAISHIAMHNLMRAIKGTVEDTITAVQHRKAEAKIVSLKKTLGNY